MHEGIGAAAAQLLWHEAACEEGGGARAALPRVVLVAVERMVVAKRQRPTVVGREEHQRRLPHLLSLERGREIGDALVEHVQHVGVRVELVAHRGVLGDLVGGRQLERRVHVLDRKVDEEGSRTRVLLDQLDGARRVEVGRVDHLGDSLDRGPVVLPQVVTADGGVGAARGGQVPAARRGGGRTAVVVALGTVEVADVRVEAAVDRHVVDGLVAEVALAHEMSRVARRGELLRDGGGGERQEVGAELATVGLHRGDG